MMGEPQTTSTPSYDADAAARAVARAVIAERFTP